MGRPHNLKLTPELEQQLLAFVRLGETVSGAALAVGVTPQCISMRRKRDPSFDLRIRQAEARARIGLLSRVQLAIEKGDGRLALRVMENRWPSEWGRAVARDTSETLTTQDIVEGIHKFLALAAGRHAPKGAKDVDADEAPEAGGA